MASFDLPHPDNRVEYDFWYTTANDEALDFLRNFGDYHKRFEKDVYFTPRFVSWSCPTCEEDFKKKHCLSDGKYCAFQFGNENHTGREILYENIREKCLHDMLRIDNKENLWWDYVKYAHINCRADINEDCSKKVLTSKVPEISYKALQQ